MSRPDESFSYAGGELPEAVVAGFRDRSQLDFDLAFFDQLLEREPDYVDVLRCQGELLTRKGQHERALVIDRRLVLLLPDDSVVHYNLACSLALLGEPREAIAALRRSLECGYRDLAYLKIDADLDTLRDEPDFQTLLSDYCSAEPCGPMAETGEVGQPDETDK
jgi:tetratricopeptide (TPR) repeat protein